MRDMSWEWLCSLTQPQEREVIDPYQYRCLCGYKWKFSWWQLLRMFIFGDYIHTCPQCQRKARYRMITHVVRDIDTEAIKENNRWLD